MRLRKLGVKASFVEGDFDGLLAGLDAGRYDMVVNGVDIDEGRKEKYDFSDPYAYGSIAVIVKSDNTDIQSMEDLKDSSARALLTASRRLAVSSPLRMGMAVSVDSGARQAILIWAAGCRRPGRPARPPQRRWRSWR